MEKIIVSFTSYPDRILTIHKVLNSIIKQTRLPDKIVLYLSLSEFVDFKDIPDLKKYQKYGFEIHWCEENLKSHKKWFYAFQEYPDDIVITIDDDILYSNTAIEILLRYHEKFAEAVIARRAHLITCNKDDSIALYNNWYNECSAYVGIPRMDLFATTGAGTLFPPHLFDKEIFHKDMFLKLCPYADDIWMKIMEVYSNIPVVLAEKTWEDHVIMKYQDNCLFECYNKIGGNDIQLRDLLKQYTHIKNGRNLEKNIFSTGRVYCCEINNIKKEELKKAFEELILKIQLNDNLLIYGAGTVGFKIYELLERRKIKNIRAFIVSNTMGNPDTVGNVPVKCYREFIRSSEKILLALMDRYETDNLRVQLIKNGVQENRILILNRLEKEALFSKLLKDVI